ncbi:unnamed protein product [Darwinula stevensoni]|uniref:Guanine nucleotide-binding protein-like 3 homolog n=1 Tax=Darwinula stevensoni TaxID=69355 RepID=A0A7R9A3B0_9CRUS|nr:unnamed protein product [Darwinula stevensoni]CAG0881737.1 unnamed protein product [Darwinula stevensoni]
MQLLGNYTRNKGLKTSIVVGVVGYPNVGKSSVINSLKHSKACSVGAIPGVTKSMQMVQLDKHIQLLDSPVMVLASSDGLDPCQVALKNAIRVESLPDPISPVEGLIQRASKKQLMLQYRLPDFKTTEEFLQVLAKRFGYLKKGGIPDVDKSARQILKHWNSGRIKYYTEPPEAPLVHVSAEIVKEMANEFRLEDLMETEDKIFTALPVVPTMDTMEIQPLVTETQHTASSLNCESKSAKEEEEDDGNDQEGKGEEREESYSKAVTRSLTSTAHEEKLLEKIKKKVERERARKKFLDPLEPGNQRLNMVRRVHMKKLARKAKKDKKRTERAAVQLADTLADTL